MAIPILVFSEQEDFMDHGSYLHLYVPYEQIVASLAWMPAKQRLAIVLEWYGRSHCHASIARGKFLVHGLPSQVRPHCMETGSMSLFGYFAGLRRQPSSHASAIRADQAELGAARCFLGGVEPHRFAHTAADHPIGP